MAPHRVWGAWLCPAYWIISHGSSRRCLWAVGFAKHLGDSSALGPDKVHHSSVGSQDASTVAVLLSGRRLFTPAEERTGVRLGEKGTVLVFVIVAVPTFTIISTACCLGFDLRPVADIEHCAYCLCRSRRS